MMDKELGVFRRIEGSCGGVGDIKLYSLDTEVSSALQMITPPSYGLGPLLLPIKRVTLLRSARRQKTFLEEDISYYKYIGNARYVIITGPT